MKVKKSHIRRGDTVKVLSGNDRGKTGKVVNVHTSTGKVTVEGVNMVTKHTKPSAQNTEGGRAQQEAPVHSSNLMLVDPATGEPTRIGRKKNDRGKLQRYSKKSGEFINQ